MARALAVFSWTHFCEGQVGFSPHILMIYIKCIGDELVVDLRYDKLNLDYAPFGSKYTQYTLIMRKYAALTTIFFFLGGGGGGECVDKTSGIHSSLYTFLCARSLFSTQRTLLLLEIWDSVVLP